MAARFPAVCVSFLHLRQSSDSKNAPHWLRSIRGPGRLFLHHEIRRPSPASHREISARDAWPRTRERGIDGPFAFPG